MKRNMGIKRRQGSPTLQKTNNNITENLLKSEGDESLLDDIRRMTIGTFNKL
jgi:hypothetical protein